MRRWLYRLLGLIPRREQRYDFAIGEGEIIEFEKPASVWQAVARINAKAR